MEFFNKRKLREKIFSLDDSNMDYNEKLINDVYKRITDSKGEIISRQFFSNINTGFSHSEERIEDGFSKWEDVYNPVLKTNLYCSINYLSKKEINFDINKFKKNYSNNFNEKMHDFLEFSHKKSEE